MQRSTHQTKQSWHGFGSYPAMVTAGVMLYNIDLLVFILLYFQNQIMLINLVICFVWFKKLFNSVIFTLKLYLFLNIFELQSVSCYIICKSWLVPKLLKLLQTWQLYDYSDHLSHHNRSGLRKMLYYKLLALQEALCLRQFELQTTF